LETFFPAYLLA